ncbi:hypothetical protein RRG08_039308 [Elysia crispata]|uniref:Uncharacterized protein n=1 Tax=Elysia crispata TaxID=231223 RepID=A0AAE0Z7B6_9GAST|nr:hypothetical protein RRG08_039308 [Elysia crispata]
MDQVLSTVDIIVRKVFQSFVHLSLKPHFGSWSDATSVEQDIHSSKYFTQNCSSYFRTIYTTIFQSLKPPKELY